MIRLSTSEQIWMAPAVRTDRQTGMHYHVMMKPAPNKSNCMEWMCWQSPHPKGVAGPGDVKENEKFQKCLSKMRYVSQEGPELREHPIDISLPADKNRAQLFNHSRSLIDRVIDKTSKRKL